MGKQLIITVGREYGSGGHAIAEALAKELDMQFYDKDMIRKVAEEHGIDEAIMEKYDEKPANSFLYRTVRGLSNAIEDHVAEKQFDYLRRKAESGESFIVVGRCSETIFKDNPNAIHIFVLAEKKAKVKRIMERYHVSESEALSKIYRVDRQRRSYHNRYSKGKWGDSRNYDICVRSSTLGIDGTVEALLAYIRAKIRSQEGT